MHRIAASMMDGSRCGRGEFAAGDSQRSRRRGYGAARPRQEMPNFRGSFAENLASCSRRARVCPRERRSTHRLATYRCWSSAWYRDACVRVFLVNAPVRFGRSVGTHLFTLSELPSLRSLTTWPGQGSWWVPTCRSSAGGGCRVGEALLQLAEHGRRQLEHQRQAVCVAHQRIQRVQTARADTRAASPHVCLSPPAPWLPAASVRCSGARRHHVAALLRHATATRPSSTWGHVRCAAAP